MTKPLSPEERERRRLERADAKAEQAPEAPQEAATATLDPPPPQCCSSVESARAQQATAPPEPACSPGVLKQRQMAEDARKTAEAQQRHASEQAKEQADRRLQEAQAAGEIPLAPADLENLRIRAAMAVEEYRQAQKVYFRVVIPPTEQRIRWNEFARRSLQDGQREYHGAVISMAHPSPEYCGEAYGASF